MGVDGDQEDTVTLTGFEPRKVQAVAHHTGYVALDPFIVN
jgi:hypothetical protein